MLQVLFIRYIDKIVRISFYCHKDNKIKRSYIILSFFGQETAVPRPNFMSFERHNQPGQTLSRMLRRVFTEASLSAGKNGAVMIRQRMLRIV